MKTLMLIAFTAIALSAVAQDEITESSGDFGLGLGLDYGGIGGRFAIRPSPGFQLIAGLGYNLAGLGFNGGAVWRISPGKKTVPTLGVMYGYNGVIVIEGASQYNKTYYGPSFSAGLEFHARKQGSYFNLEIILPLRPQAFTDDLNALKSNPAISFKNEPWPIAISLGYHWGFK